jgi:hypothetical protein
VSETVTAEWLRKLPDMPESEALAAIRTKAAALYRAKRGRDPSGPEERRQAVELLSAAAERVKRTAANGNGGAGKVGLGDPRTWYARVLSPLERRQLDDEIDRLDDRGW